jgi:glycopeptide antibiotics resistance protein
VFTIQGSVVWLTWPVVAGLVVSREVRQHAGLWHALGVLALATYAVWIASVAFFPMPLLPNDHFMEEWGFLNLVPLRSLVDSFSNPETREVIRLNGGNFFLLVPYSLVGPLLWPSLRRWWKALVLGLGISLTIELVQFILGKVVGDYYRSVDIDDVILDTAGALFGYGLYVLAQRRARSQSPLGNI